MPVHYDTGAQQVSQRQNVYFVLSVVYVVYVTPVGIDWNTWLALLSVLVVPLYTYCRSHAADCMAFTSENICHLLEQRCLLLGTSDTWVLWV